MDQHTLDILEFDRIMEILAIYASSSLGKSLAMSIQTSTNIDVIRIWQRQVTELKKLIGDDELPLGGIRDIRGHLESLHDPIAVLGCEALLDVHSTLRAARLIKGYLSDLTDDEYPNLIELAKKISPFRSIEDKIYTSIDTQGVVKDNATPKLHSIRKEINAKRARIKSRLQSLLKSAHLTEYLQGGTITIRKDRSVIPIKARFRDKVPGIIRDYSDSGETVFIEPSAVSDSGDALQSLIQDEREETFRILSEIAEDIRIKLDDISQTLKMLSIVDLIYAKACMSRDFMMSEPVLNADGKIDIKKARHPLLVYERGWGRHPIDEAHIEKDTDSVVPINLNLGIDFDTLVITGPNTGGKTVTLKTIGLLSIMAHAGIHIPASEGSQIAIFQNIYADIGDEQSIEQNLSTFSAHLTQIVRILNQADDRSLTLLDELGTGTDPQEGAALGTAIVDYLLEKRAKTIATTHLSALKTYAHIHPRIENASVEFDMKTLQPTYRLFIGTFGSSNALSIAQRLGIPRKVISRANELVEKEDVRVEELINALQQTKANLEDEREATLIIKKETQEIKQNYETMLKELQEREERLKAQYNLPDDEIEEEKPSEPVPVTFAELQKGDMVHVNSLNAVGEVLKKMPDKSKILLRIGFMKVEVYPDDLLLVSG